MEKLKRFLKEEEGAMLIEYSLIGALIAVALIGAMTILASDIELIFSRIGDALDTAGTG